MAKTLHISFLLDETGSMSSNAIGTICAFNEYVESLKEGEHTKKAKFSLMKFNSTRMTQVYDSIPVSKIELLNNDNYHPSSTTPLYDAVGGAIKFLGKKKNVLLVVQTDGMENASREFTQKQIFDLVTKKREKGWEFVFMGADIDTWVGEQMGIARGSTISYDGNDPLKVYRPVR